ncbi:hypothetical protein EXIGUO8H_360006 [Exiguobacterium sp. 8H]|nr:hypothetical protein EXIGUO8H_360006 [Exiguobacterium sp. 8H]
MKATPDTWKTTTHASWSHPIRQERDVYLFTLHDGGHAVVVTPGGPLRARQLLRHVTGMPGTTRPHVACRKATSVGWIEAERRQGHGDWFGEEGVLFMGTGRVRSR